MMEQYEAMAAALDRIYRREPEPRIDPPAEDDLDAKRERENRIADENEDRDLDRYCN